jgi:hypothetical protein
MAKRSAHFFTYGNNPIAKLPDYLESMLKKMTKDFNFSSHEANTSGTNASNEDSTNNGSIVDKGM